MLNKEKYAKNLYDIFLNSFGVDEENKPFRCSELQCGKKCQFYNQVNDETGCKALAKQWLGEEYKTDWSKVPVDTPILVKGAWGVRWLHRHFAKYENGKVFAWADGTTSWTSGESACTDWEYARLCEDNK